MLGQKASTMDPLLGIISLVWSGHWTLAGPVLLDSARSALSVEQISSKPAADLWAGPIANVREGNTVFDSFANLSLFLGI